MSRSTALDVGSLEVDLDGAAVLRGVDLSVATGEWVNIIGPNGAGKTTLLRALLGAVNYSGSLEIDGVDDGRPATRARTLAYVPQTPVIPSGMPVIDYVLLGRVPHLGPFAAETSADLAIAAEVLARLDLDGFADREVRSLSGGERQRVLLARALAQQAPVLLLDEPTTALDLGHQQDVLELIEELRVERALTVVATLHDLTLAARYGDRLALLWQGRVEHEGTPTEVLTQARVQQYFAASVKIIDDPDGPIIVPTPKGSRHE